MNRHLTWLLPMKLELILYGIISVLTLTGALMYAYFKSIDPVVVYGANRSILDTLDSWLISLDQIPATKTIVQYLFWYIAGIVIFSVALYFKRALDEVGQDINVAFRYHHPKDFSQLSFWSSVLRHALFHIIAVTVTIGVITFLAYLATPLTKIAVTEIIYATTTMRVALSVVAFLSFIFLSLVCLSFSFRALFLGRLP